MWPNPQETDLVTFTEEILNEKPHFLCSDSSEKFSITYYLWELFTLTAVT